MIGRHQTKSFSGTVEQSSELGLPDVPQVGPTSGAGTGSLAELLTGPHSARVYVDGSTKARIQVMDRMAERDAVRHGNELWLSNSKDNTATHVTLPDIGVEGIPQPGHAGGCGNAGGPGRQDT